MIRGIYTAASGMLAESLRNDAIANNLANANTAGYKKDVAVTKDFASMLIKRMNYGEEDSWIGTLGVGSMVDEIATIHNPGMMSQTGNDLDMAINGKGFFTVETPNGVRYTRNGAFTLNAQGELVTQDGYRVMGRNGAIRVNGKLSVTGNGSIAINGVQTDQLQLVEFANEKQLVKEGANLFTVPNGVQGQPATGQVKQGLLEQSNVNVVSEMVNLIAGYRAYEVNGKAVQSHDQLMDKAVNEVGKV